MKSLVARILRPLGRRQKAARYLHRVFEPALFQTAHAWLKVKGWVPKVTALNSIVDGYFALAGPIEPEDLQALRLKIQEKIEKKLDVDIGVSRNSCVWFSSPRIELTTEDLRPEKEVAR